MKKQLRSFGFGGQGIITLTRLLGESGIADGKEVIMTEEYSPYITGGWSRADLIISDEKIDYPIITEIDYLIALSQEGFDKNRTLLTDEGLIFVDTGMVETGGSDGERILGIGAREMAESMGYPKVANIIMLGFFNRVSGVISGTSLEEAVKKRFPKHQEVNLAALEAGYREAIIHV